MSFFKRHLVFSVILGVILAGTLVLGWFVYASWNEINVAKQAAQEKATQLQGFMSRPIYPNRDNAESVRQELQNAQKALGAMFDLLESKDKESVKFPAPPATPTEAYFSLGRFVEDSRNKCEEIGISIRPEESFGFLQYANQGPKADVIERVFKQRYLAEIILNALFKAKPPELLALKREAILPPAPTDGSTPPAGATSAPTAPDLFVVPAEITARKEGFIATIPFQVQFSGYTNSLRVFLNELAKSPYPLVVRSVEVVPQTATKTSESGQREGPPRRPLRPSLAGGAQSPFGSAPQSPFGAPPTEGETPVEDKPVQIISQNLSTFTVTLEYIELIAKKDGQASNP